MQAVIGLGAPDALPNRARTAGMLVLGYLIALWASLSLTTPDHVPLFWLCNAFIAAMVILVEDAAILRLAVAVCLVCTVPVLQAFHTPGLVLAATRAVLNVVEGLVCGWLANRVLGPRRLLRSPIGYLKLQILAILPAALLNSALRDLTLRALGHVSMEPAWRVALLPHLLGLATALPALLLMVQPAPCNLRRSGVETVFNTAALALAAHLLFNVYRLPTAFVLCPLVLLAAVRLGPRGSVLGHLAVAAVCLPGTITGRGSFALHPGWDAQTRAMLYQCAILFSGFGVSICAFMVAEHARLRRLLTMRATAAREARRRALAASRAKSEFLATMSHEIRTPMNSILGFTQILLHSPGVSAAARGQVKMIAEAGGSLMTVLNDILDFSKVEAGQIELHLEPVDLEALLSAAAEMMREPARAKRLTLRLETQGLEGKAFNLDGQRLRQVLLNLLNNAVKFTAEGHILLSASLDPGKEALRFEVSDTGIGIDEDVLGRLFTRFTQADSSTTRHYGGSGLGLAICKGLVERMGGRIGADSRPGHGSCFWFELPAHPAAAARGPQADRQPAQSLNARVLLVDDHPMNLRLGETLLTLLGCEVDLAASGEDAVQACRAQVYDAVLMDVHMPGMDGPATTRAIRALGGAGGQVPIIAMSADVMPQSVERCRAAGMVGHLAKPVQLQTLHETLARLMTEQARRSAAA